MWFFLFQGPYDMECEICLMKFKKSSAHKKHQPWCERSTALKCEICQKDYWYEHYYIIIIIIIIVNFISSWLMMICTVIKLRCWGIWKLTKIDFRRNMRNRIIKYYSFFGFWNLIKKYSLFSDCNNHLQHNGNYVCFSRWSMIWLPQRFDNTRTIKKKLKILKQMKIFLHDNYLISLIKRSAINYFYVLGIFTF